MAIKVYVSKKLPKEFVGENDLIPSTLVSDGKEYITDVEESTIPQASTFTAKCRPLIAGASINAQTLGGGVGTIGCCITLDNDETYILSCNHVLVANNLPKGTSIIQSAVYDGGVPSNSAYRYDGVATLYKFVPLCFGGSYRHV